MKIKKLTKEQEELLPVYRDKWIRIGLETAPADRERAERAIRLMYAGAHLPAPVIIWCGSPFSQSLTRALVSNLASVRDSVLGSVGTAVSELESVSDSVGDSVWRPVRESVRDSVSNSVWESVSAQVWRSVDASVAASVSKLVREPVWTSVEDSVRDSMEALVRRLASASVRDSLVDLVSVSVWNSVKASVWDSVGSSLWTPVAALVRDLVRDQVLASMKVSVWNTVGGSGYGQHDADWLAFHDFFRGACGLVRQTDPIAPHMEQAQSAGWYLPYRHICWVSERHNVLRRDERGRLHCASGPAVSYPDGWSIYAYHGVRVPAEVIEQRDKITPDKILSESNVEVRRVMMELYGLERFAQDAGAQVISRSREHAAELLALPLPEDDPEKVLKAVRLTCPATGRVYFERVPPDVTDVLSALAWRANVGSYKPRWQC